MPGISAEEAKSAGVFAAPGDATLSIDSVTNAAGANSVAVTVRNVGGIDEDYVLVFLDGSREILRIPIAVSGHQSVTRKVSLEDERASRVRLDGKLRGEGVAELPVK